MKLKIPTPADAANATVQATGQEVIQQRQEEIQRQADATPGHGNYSYYEDVGASFMDWTKKFFSSGDE